MILNSERGLMLIKKYFRNELSEVEKKEFDELSKNSDFQNEIILQSEVLNVFFDERRNSVKSLMSDARSEIKRRSNPKNQKVVASPNTGIKKVIAAIVFLAILISGYFIFNNILDKQKLDTLFVEYNQPYPSQITKRGTEVALIEEDAEALSLYNKGNYEEALAQFQKSSSITDRNKMYQASCLLELDKPKAALIILEELSEIEDINLFQQVQWKIAMVHLRNKNSEKLHDILKTISATPNHLFQQKSKLLLSDITN